MSPYRMALRLLLGLALVALARGPILGAAPAAAPGAPPGIVSHIKVLSDKVPDVSSLDAWQKSSIKPGMSDKEKALAAWKTVVMFQHQDAPPVEFLNWENAVHDAIKLFNVYGYAMCGNATSHVLALGRHEGLEGRGWTIVAHCVPEIRFDNTWHLLDASLINYLPKPDGQIASVGEIVGAVQAWLVDHPDFKGNDAKLRAFHQENGWTGWKRGPALLAACPFYGADGWLPARTHGWYSTMQEYDGSNLVLYESGYSLGYQVNVQLRPGERLTRNWFNKGLHVNMDGAGDAPGCLKMETGKQFLCYTPAYGDLAPGRVGNGTYEYDVPLASGAFRGGALAAENLAAKSEDPAGPAVHVKDPSKPATLILRMPSSYVYLGGTLAFKPVVGEGGAIAVALSDNNGLDWKDLATAGESAETTVDLKSHVFRRYDYRLKFTLKGKGTGLDALRIAGDIQHSQRPLPALDKGRNTITFSAGPQEGTVTLEGSTDAKNKAKQLLYTDFHPERKNIKDDLLVLSAATGELEFPIETPGDITRIRVGCCYRARDPKDQWDVQVSYDGGKTFRGLGVCEGPKVCFAKSFTAPAPGPGTRSAVVRLAGSQRTVAMFFNLRIDADYKEPAGGFRPVKVTYVWDEGGTEKRDVHVAQKPQETYTITCQDKPTMKSLILELAD